LPFPDRFGFSTAPPLLCEIDNTTTAMADEAAAAKARGNAALGAKDFDLAVTEYTAAIGKRRRRRRRSPATYSARRSPPAPATGFDASNHVFYSNRSAAYASLKKFGEALADAEQCIKLKPEFAKGYGRKGAALHGLGATTGEVERYQDAITAYDEGLKIDPSNQMLISGARAAQQEGQASQGAGIGGLFSAPDTMAKLMANDETYVLLLLLLLLLLVVVLHLHLLVLHLHLLHLHLLLLPLLLVLLQLLLRPAQARLHGGPGVRGDHARHPGEPQQRDGAHAGAQRRQARHAVPDGRW